jgi:G:T-mismatch repair DNA endonuclease (very short patch repair protein)
MPLNNPENTIKRNQALINKYGTANPMEVPGAKENWRKSIVMHPHFNASKPEIQLKKTLSDLGIEFKTKRIYENYVDACVFLENGDRLVVMVDGEYWHNLVGMRKLNSIYEAKKDVDFMRLAKQLKDQLFNMDCEKDRKIHLIRIKADCISDFINGKESLGFYYACGDVGVIDDFMKKINKELEDNND